MAQEQDDTMVGRIHSLTAGRLVAKGPAMYQISFPEYRYVSPCARDARWEQGIANCDNSYQHTLKDLQLMKRQFHLEM
jgi:hypothetical protein